MSNSDSMAMMLRSLRLPAIQREYTNLSAQATANDWSFEKTSEPRGK